MKSRASKSIQTSDEGSNGLCIISHLTHFMPIKIKFKVMISYNRSWNDSCQGCRCSRYKL